jgi:type I restriction enzyme, S subunit
VTKLHRPLGELAEFINGVAFRPEDWGDEGMKIVRIQNLTDATKPYNRTTRRVDPKYIVQKADLLVSWSASLGVFPWNDEEPALVNQHIFKVIPRANLVDKAYLRHALEGALSDMEKHLHGATMQHVNRAEFLGTRIPLPPMEEQQRIAAILDRAEALRAKRRHALAKLDSLTQSLFLGMFGDVKTRSLEMRPLQSLIRENDRINYGVVQPGRDYPGGRPFIRVGDFTEGMIRLDEVKYIDPEIESTYKRSRLKGDEVLVSCVGSIGTVALCDRSVSGFNIARAVARVPFDAKRIDGIYLLHYLRTDFVQDYFKAQLRTVNQPTLNIKQITETPVYVPSELLQRKFAERTNQLKCFIEEHRCLAHFPEDV